MGLRESKVVLDVLSEAYFNAEQSRRNKIEVDLRQPFIESLQQIWCNIPSSIQELIIGKSGGEKGTKPKRRRKLPKRNRQPIPRDDNLMSKLPAWGKDPLMFFEIGGRRLTFTENPIAEAKDYMLELNERNGMDMVRFRLLQVAFDRLKTEKFGAIRLRSNNAESFAQVLSRSGICGNLAADKISSWADQGKKIDGLCKALGSVRQIGYSHLAHLFFLQDIADTTIKEQKQKGETWKETIQILKDRVGASDEDRLGLERLANDLMDKIWNQFQISISRSNLGWELRQTEFRVQQEVHLPRQNPTPTFTRQINATPETSSPTFTADSNIGQSGGCNLHGTGNIIIPSADRPGLQGADDEMDLEREAVNNSLSIRRVTSCYDTYGSGRASVAASNGLTTSDVDEFESPLPLRSSEVTSIIDSTVPSFNENSHCQTDPMTLNSCHGESGNIPQPQRHPDGAGADFGSRHQVPTSAIREGNDHPEAGMQVEPTHAGFCEVIVGASHTDINNMNSTYWPDQLHGGHHHDTNNTGWLQSPIDVNATALPEAALRSDQPNIPANDFHNELNSLFDARCTSDTLPSPMLWRLFTSANDSHHSNILSNYSM